MSGRSDSVKTLCMKEGKKGSSLLSVINLPVASFLSDLKKKKYYCCPCIFHMFSHLFAKVSFWNVVIWGGKDCWGFPQRSHQELRGWNGKFRSHLAWLRVCMAPSISSGPLPWVAFSNCYVQSDDHGKRSPVTLN